MEKFRLSDARCIFEVPMIWEALNPFGFGSQRQMFKNSFPCFMKNHYIDTGHLSNLRGGVSLLLASFKKECPGWFLSWTSTSCEFNFNCWMHRPSALTMFRFNDFKKNH